MRNLLPLLFFLMVSCDSTDQLAVQQVDSSDRLSDSELQQLQAVKHQAEYTSGTYHFGFDLRASPQEDAAQYLPFLNYLEATTGYHFEIHFTPQDSSAADELGQNHTQFAAMGASSFLYAESRYGAKLLVRGLNSKAKAEYQSVFVVKPGGGLRNIKDIKARKLAFGGRDSTQGHLIPRIMLSKNNINLKQLASYRYTGSHQNCAEAVVSGKYDVCGMQDQLAEELESQGRVEIIYRSDYYPSSGIVVNQSVPQEVAERVKQALLNFKPLGKDNKGLYHWERTEMANGFTLSRPGDYDELRDWSIKLGFLQKEYAQESVK